VEVKQKEIVDSITYAKRLQQAILTKEDSILEFFPASFLLYKPKDIVAGDFYFFETTDTHVFYAAADCTGHGVPGAMVSIICSNALSRSIKEFGISDPGKILDKTKELVVETFQKSGTDVRDGMDISIISKHIETNEIRWAGAHNPLWIIEDNELIEIKPDKQPIGKSEKTIPFTTHVVKAKVNAMLYLITDGFADQFGGSEGKKFKKAQFKSLLLGCNQESATKQKDLLNSEFNKWKGSLEQLDDVCVIGVRV
jgi:serine phosphatase RsbU (regulator of sigma subunit)